MTIARNVLEAIGRTPLIRLNRASDATGCEILGKAEFMNPGQSVKDRAALYIIRDAERRGLLRPGGRIVEGTAGNTGIGLAMVGQALGYRTTIVIPRTQSQEKKDAIRLLGAELVEVDAVPYSNPDNYVRYSGRLAEELNRTEPNGAIWANQFDNVANRQAHVETTGPEIWEQTGGRVDGFICAVGSGGTLAGVAEALKARSPSVRIGLADPMGAALYNWYAHGELKSEGTSISEGIGQGRITANLEGLVVDMPYQVPDDEMLDVIFDLATHEGLIMGGSTGINVAGAMRMARDLGPGHTIVTILCDQGARYQSKIYNPAFLAERGLPVPGWLA
ncbi:MAG: cysteine synthase A [Phenylobacterium sp.]|jgi:cysteine synthase A|uniref:cysteine synthase A n=1 Tax=Phenylobacterium sp. TaxID=1871053 RepID=UPI0025E11426|nr:cysteine synthase A [Phenylobacterium sp.]MCA3713586.1 cysteine synthase A [Phenylobacterium sp.]MCA3725793.1 cysteine synthase A [Phenylobacterium sp.]MCA3754314.1 cysteine synthase A [Phenylobacterium sp.]MCA4917498.1 cysteine synthase A [Phenylobacterium sp.]MCA6241861.1 cysteine synthase A [Phenylobacterium sp.]